MTAKRTPRGIRNHNPGNIEYRPKTQWQGQIGTDGRFVIFSAPEYGIRAIIKILQNYQRKHGLKSVSAMLQRWAPPSENHTSAYIETVAKAIGQSPQADVDLSNPQVVDVLLRAIIQVENGRAWADYYSDEVIAEGLRLANVKGGAVKTVMRYPRTTATAAGATATVAGASVAIEQINNSLEGLQQLGSGGALLISRLSDAKSLLLCVIVAAMAVGIYVAYTKYREVRK